MAANLDGTGEPGDISDGDGQTQDPYVPVDITGNPGVGSDDNLYLPGEGEGIVDEEPAPEFYTQGVSHSSVADIQQRLMDLGFMDYSEPTMYYGSITAKAVEMFQRQHELKQDGIIGPETRQLLFSDDARYYLAKAGMDGDDIKRIQRRLYEMGYLAKSEYVTGHFGDVTEAAVKQMQQNNGLAADGKVGHDTMEMLYSETAKANIVSYGDKSEVVLACQERLKELGYLTTKPDGQYGNDTVAAVKQFQSRNDLVVDGFLGPTTMQVLNGSDAVANGMMIGESGDTVKRVQELLAKYGYMSSSNCTGYFGEVTEEAVKAFQKKNGLTVDGNVGMKTMAKLTSGDPVRANGGSQGSSSGSSSSSSSNKGSSSSGSNSSSSSSSSVNTGSASVSALLKVAKSKLGKPYVYGAKGPNAFDCSGYVYWCLNQVGIKQSYVTSYGWRTIGKYQKITSFSNIKAGDIVVVRGHVGIAAGNGMVYDASSSSGKIVYRSLGAWWKSNFICAWRIF
ncbi:MAG: peptidoglycan-binding protein [Lachnospiraceae bacterium]|nr:peptidoglycan-binding protein [Lachnospiraceae bacterium]